jgi:heme/copper-type cytochrome/quinol oxidase subunit 2
MIVRAWWAGRTPAAGDSRRPRAREFVWVALPIVALAATLVVTWRTVAAVDVPNQQPPIHIEQHHGRP